MADPELTTKTGLCESCGGPTDDHRYCPACACPRCGGLGQGDGGRSVRRWEAGDRPISGPVRVAVRLMLRERELMLQQSRTAVAFRTAARLREDRA